MLRGARWGQDCLSTPPSTKRVENCWNYILSVGPKGLEHFLELEEACVLALLVSEWFQCYKQLLDVSMKALLWALIPLSQKRKLNLSCASEVSAVEWDGNRGVGHCCSNSCSSVCILKESSFFQFWKKRFNHLSLGECSRLWIPQGEEHLWIIVKERVSGLSIPSRQLLSFGFLRYWEPKKFPALFFCLALGFLWVWMLLWGADDV